MSHAEPETVRICVFGSMICRMRDLVICRIAAGTRRGTVGAETHYHAIPTICLDQTHYHTIPTISHYHAILTICLD